MAERLSVRVRPLFSLIRHLAPWFRVVPRAQDSWLCAGLEGATSLMAID
jgi:hypothetical protein